MIARSLQGLTGLIVLFFFRGKRTLIEQVLDGK